MLSGNITEISIVLASMMISLLAYLLIVRKDDSWINWATPFFILGLGSHYILPMLFLALTRGASGSLYAYYYTYATYGFSFLSASLAYCYLKPLRLRPSRTQVSDRRLLIFSWVMLGIGVLCYSPVLIEFHAYLAEPRRIYEMTRSGYGIYFFTSTFFATIGFITFLFCRRKYVWGALSFYGILTIFTYWHGSKGQLINYLLVWMLYRVYVQRHRVRALAAMGMVAGICILLISFFALFSNIADLAQLGNDLTGYADTVRNVLTVIDDPRQDCYYGRLTFETEIYTRIPRILMPNKPKDFGPYLIARKYSPEAHRSDQGDPSYDIGVTYADFGVFTILLLCFGSAGMAWLTACMVADQRCAPTPGRFLLMLFLSGVNVIPISGVFLLPETVIIGALLSIALRLKTGGSRGRCCMDRAEIG